MDLRKAIIKSDKILENIVQSDFSPQICMNTDYQNLVFNIYQMED